MKTELFKIGTGFARRKQIPMMFAGIILKETAKAYYIYGRGTTESAKMSFCCVCGRTLTHPVSVELGIGPQCGGHWHDWNAIGGYTEENIERLKGAMKDIVVDTWMPKAVVKETFESSSKIEVPSNHIMLNGNKWKWKWKSKY